MHSCPSMRLEPYDTGHEAELVSMWRESFEFGVGIVDPHPFDKQVGYFRDHVLATCELRVALDGSSLAGFIAATPTRIDQLYVRVGQHRRGVGTALLEWAKSRSAGSLELYTFARNGVARAFYERHGFVVERHGFEPEWQLDDVLYRWQRPGSKRRCSEDPPPPSGEAGCSVLLPSAS